jgi:hypothetical protein
MVGLLLILLGVWHVAEAVGAAVETKPTDVTRLHI